MDTGIIRCLVLTKEKYSKKQIGRLENLCQECKIQRCHIAIKSRREHNGIKRKDNQIVIIILYLDELIHHKDNYPTLLSAELATYIFSFIGKFAPSISYKMVDEGLNKRLGTEGLRIPEITIEAAKRGIEIKDEWIYSDRPSQVCSSFVIGLYKAAGLFGEYYVEATEFTPKDVDQLNFLNQQYQDSFKAIESFTAKRPVDNKYGL